MSGGDRLDGIRMRLAAGGGGFDAPRLANAIREESGGLVGDTELLAAMRQVHTEMVGAGPLQVLLENPSVTDILVTSPSGVWCDEGRGLRPLAGSWFADEAAVRRLAQRLALSAGRRLDDGSPWVDAALPAAATRSAVAVRLHAILPPLAAAGTCISLRILRPVDQGFSQLQAGGMISESAAALLRNIVAARLAFVVTGATGSGKTTVLSALLGLVECTERIITVEDAAELAPGHPHIVPLVARPANVEGAGLVTIRELLRQALRMRPDRIVIGEVRGAEVVDLLAALNTGHEGGAGTVHANAPRELPARMEALAAVGGLSRDALRSQLVAAIHIVVHLARDERGRRVIAEVAVLGRGESGIQIDPAYRDDRVIGNRHPDRRDCRVGLDRLGQLLADRGVGHS